MKHYSPYKFYFTKYKHEWNDIIVMMVLNILLVTKKIILLNRYVLSCLKSQMSGYIKYIENGGKNIFYDWKWWWIG